MAIWKKRSTPVEKIATKSRVFPLHNIPLRLTELDNTGVIKSKLQQILSDNKQLFAQDNKVREFVEQYLPNSELDTITLQEAVNGLNLVVQAYYTEPVFYEYDNVQEKHKIRVSNVIDGIKQYIIDGKTTLNKLSKRSFHDPTHKGLTSYMQEKKLIGLEDIVIVSGGGSPQICIVNKAEAKDVSRSDAWFLWNVDSGGMFTPGETRSRDVRTYHFGCKIDLGETEAFKRDVASFRDNVNEVIGKAFEQGSDLATRVREELPRLRVNQRLGESLRLVEYAQESRWFHSGSIKKGDLLSYEGREKNGPILSVARIINSNQITNNEYMLGGGINVDLLYRFLRSKTLCGVYDFQAALAAMQKRVEDVEPNFVDKFTGIVGPYRNSGGRYNIFKWFFYNWDCGRVGLGGYTGFIKYNPENMLQGINWLIGETTELTKKSKYFKPIQKAITEFRKSGAYSELQKLTYNRSSGRGSSYFEGHDNFGGYSYREEYGDEKDSSRLKDKFSVGRDFGEFGKYGPGGYFSRFGAREYIRSGDQFDKETFTNDVLEISKKYENQVGDLEVTLRELEYVMIWAKFFNKIPVTTIVPNISHANKEISIKEGRNLPLVLAKEDAQQTVVPNDIYFNDEQHTIMITGANGGGKTHLLEMLANNTILAHKGLRVLALQMNLPALGAFEYGVNLSVHGESASTYQNEMRQLIDLVSRVEREMLPGEKGLVILDEPGRGTDSQDGIPIIVGLMKYFEQRGIYFAYSTHFNHLGELDKLLQEEGIHVGVYTMDREHFKLKQGVGRSEGIDVAKKRQLDTEIIVYAHKVANQAEKSEIKLVQNVLGKKDSSQTFRLLSKNDLDELGMYKKVKSSNDWGEHYQVASATRCFAEHSILRSDEYVDKGDRQYLPAMRPDAAQAFMDVLTTELSDKEQNVRVDTLERLVGGVNPLYSRLEENVESLKEFMTLFSLYQKKRQKGIEGIFAQMSAGLNAALEIQDEKILYNKFLGFVEKNNIAATLRSLGNVVAITKDNDLAACNNEVKILQDFLKSDAYEELNEFISEYRFLGEGKFDNRDSSEIFTVDNWKDWVNLCVDYGADLIKVHEAVLRLNFYNVAARTIKEKTWRRVDENASDGSIKVQAGRNTRLEYVVDDVTPIDIELGLEKPINIISGTNGGGKTQFLQLVGSLLYFKRQLGYVPAELAKMGNISFLYTMISTAEHGQEQSSFQNEVSRISAGIEEYKAAGEPSNGVVLLDEPFKGTSEEEAIPLLVGLIKYFERRKVQVVFTTHFSGLFDYLNRLDEASAVSYRPLFVDYFTPQDRFKVKEGKGKSSGIRVAEDMKGLPQEIIDTAKIVHKKLYG